jgi:hypothetical protein
MISEGSIHYCVIKKMITSDEISFDYNKRWENVDRNNKYIDICMI